MAHGLTYIPLSLPHDSILNKICNNDNINFRIAWDLGLVHDAVCTLMKLMLSLLQILLRDAVMSNDRGMYVRPWAMCKRSGKPGWVKDMMV